MFSMEMNTFCLRVGKFKAVIVHPFLNFIDGELKLTLHPSQSFTPRRDGEVVDKQRFIDASSNAVYNIVYFDVK